MVRGGPTLGSSPLRRLLRLAAVSPAPQTAPKAATTTRVWEVGGIVATTMMKAVAGRFGRGGGDGAGGKPTTDWFRRALLFLPITLASYSLLRQYRLVGMVVGVGGDRQASATSSGLLLQPMVRFVAPPASDDKHRGPAASLSSSGARLLPEIVWLASYPNSGTSYTMTLVERASNRSTASNYGDEVTLTNDTSVPVHDGHLRTGPYWEGLHGRMGRTIRPLPDSFVLTKTHCGGRCIHCGAVRYTVNSTDDFLRSCLRTSYRINGTRHESYLDPSTVARLVHLFRNPLHNVVARYHLDRRHLVNKDPGLAGRYPHNATGFQLWCQELDELYEPEEAMMLSASARRLLASVPCRGEFYKYAQWHEHALRMPSLLPAHRSTTTMGDDALPIPVLIVHYEDYQHRFNWSVSRLMDFVEQDVVSPLRPFRSLPAYEDHYTPGQVEAIRTLIRGLASPRLWRHLERYF